MNEIQYTKGVDVRHEDESAHRDRNKDVAVTQAVGTVRKERLGEAHRHGCC